ncbi:chromate transporter [bacterium 210820-DFI.6.37]|nr:chromate transporter [bacterium 210820-DFI.6.37]
MMFFYLFSMFFRIGLFSFGGGLAMLPLIFQSVQDFGFMTSAEFSNLVALSQVTPGPIAVNAATYVGLNYAGVLGAVVATLGVCLPSFILVLIVMKFMEKFKESKGLEGAFFGIRPVTVGLIGAAAIFVAETSLVNGDLFSTALFKNPGSYINAVPCVIFAVSLVLAGKFKISPIKVTILMAVVGAVLCG